MNFKDHLRSGNFLLSEGALVERLKKEHNFTPDCFINHAGIIYDDPGKLSGLYKQYIEIAQKYDLAVMIMTPTRKVNAETVAQSGYAGKDVIADACAFLKNIRSGYPDFADRIFIGGLLGCKGDAFQAGEALGTEESYDFHKIQVARFKKAQVDYLFAGIMPDINEATGMAKAMAESGIPYIVSFSIRKNGCLLDGTSIVNAIRIIDSSVQPKPMGYMSNCIHPVNLRLALENEANGSSPALERFIGVQANASSLSPEELNNCGSLRQEDFGDMVDEISFLTHKYKFRILGGCCGTDHVFMEKLAKSLKSFDE